MNFSLLLPSIKSRASAYLCCCGLFERAWPGPSLWVRDRCVARILKLCSDSTIMRVARVEDVPCGELVIGLAALRILQYQVVRTKMVDILVSVKGYTCGASDQQSRDSVCNCLRLVAV